MPSIRRLRIGACLLPLLRLMLWAPLSHLPYRPYPGNPVAYSSFASEGQSRALATPAAAFPAPAVSHPIVSEDAPIGRPSGVVSPAPPRGIVAGANVALVQPSHSAPRAPVRSAEPSVASAALCPIGSAVTPPGCQYGTGSFVSASWGGSSCSCPLSP